MSIRTLCFWIVFGAVSLSARERLSLEQLRAELAKHISHERFAAATWGIKAVSLKNGVVLFETNSTKLLKPASNAKLYTGALALDRFGPEFRIRTSVFARTEPRNGVIPGDLVVYGRGDPSISARFNGGSYTNLFAEVISELKRVGVRRIEGNLVGNESFFSGPRYGSGWTWDDLNYYYGAEVSALTVQDNVIDLILKPGARVGQPAMLELKPATDFLRFSELPVTAGTNRESSLVVRRDLASREVRLSGVVSQAGQSIAEAVTVPDPALWFVTMLRAALANEGITIDGGVRTGGSTNGLKEIAAIHSKPMSELVEKMMKPSQNLYAQLLWLQAGSAMAGAGTTEDRGQRAMRAFLQKAGINPRGVLLEEGSGLSRACLVTPAATVDLLSFMARHEHAAAFENSLPEPGEGTLRRRLTDLSGRLRAKTGTIRYVNALSGYVTSGAGERIAFSILLNAYDPLPGASARDDVDVIPRLLSAFSGTNP